MFSTWRRYYERLCFPIFFPWSPHYFVFFCQRGPFWHLQGLNDLRFHTCRHWSVLWLSGKFYWQVTLTKCSFIPQKARARHNNEIIDFLISSRTQFALGSNAVNASVACPCSVCMNEQGSQFCPRCGYQCQPTSRTVPPPVGLPSVYLLLELESEKNNVLRLNQLPQSYAKQKRPFEQNLLAFLASTKE